MRSRASYKRSGTAFAGPRPGEAGVIAEAGGKADTESISTLSTLPAVNAALNAGSAVLVATARRFIRHGKVAAHRALMLAAVATSTAFLVSYLYYHSQVGSVRFQGQGWSRPLY